MEGGRYASARTLHKWMLEGERTKSLWGNKGNPTSPAREALDVTARLSCPMRSKFSKVRHLTGL